MFQFVVDFVFDCTLNFIFFGASFVIVRYVISSVRRWIKDIDSRISGWPESRRLAWNWFQEGILASAFAAIIYVLWQDWRQLVDPSNLGTLQFIVFKAVLKIMAMTFALIVVTSIGSIFAGCLHALYRVHRRRHPRVDPV